MKMKKHQKISTKNVVLIVGMVFILSLVIGSVATAAQSPTVADSKGIKTDYPQQLELDKFEKQTGKKLKFHENPLFAEKVKKGAVNSGGYVLPMSRAHRRSWPGAMPTSCASVMTHAPSYPTWPRHGNGTMTIPRLPLPCVKVIAGPTARRLRPTMWSFI